MSPRPTARAPKPYVAWDDATLVAACIEGDEDAWAALIHRYKRLIYSIPVRYGASPDDAADIFQAVCMEMLGQLHRLRKVESLRSWIMTITAHQAFHWKRGQRARALRETGPIDPEQAPDAAGLPPDLLNAAEQQQVLRDAVASLPARCHELIRLLFFETPPLAYAEAARRLGLATGSIGFIRGRCLAKLRRALDDLGFDA